MSAVTPFKNPGFALMSGQQANRVAGRPGWDTATGLVATPSGVQATAVLVPATVTCVDTVATAADAVKLPPAVEGRVFVLSNRGVASMQVFGSGSDTIDGVATATGVAQGNGLTAMYIAVRSANSSIGVAGQWVRMLSA